MTYLDVLAGAGAGFAGLLAFTQAAMTSAPQFGWLARHWAVRLLMGAAGIVMIARCQTSLTQHQTFNPIGALVIFILAALFLAELVDLIARSWRGQAAEVARLAAEPKRAARRLFLLRLRRQEAVTRETQATATAAAADVERMRRETAWLRMEPPAYTEITRPPPPSRDD